MPHCIVPGCNSNSRQEKKVGFHEFPSCETRRNEWLKAISRQGDEKGSQWFPSQHSTICALHFSDESYKPTIKRKVLKQNAVPSIFPSYPSYMLPKETTPRRKIKKFALDVDNCPVAEKIEDTAKEQSCDFQLLGEASSSQTPLEPEYSSTESFGTLNKRCQLVNRQLRNKSSLLSKTKKKLTASIKKYDTLLKSYKNLLHEYESLNLDELKQMEANNLKRQFLLDQLSALSKKKTKMV